MISLRAPQGAWSAELCACTTSRGRHTPHKPTTGCCARWLSGGRWASTSQMGRSRQDLPSGAVMGQPPLGKGWQRRAGSGDWGPCHQPGAGTMSVTCCPHRRRVSHPGPQSDLCFSLGCPGSEPFLGQLRIVRGHFFPPLTGARKLIDSVTLE